VSVSGYASALVAKSVAITSVIATALALACVACSAPASTSSLVRATGVSAESSLTSPGSSGGADVDARKGRTVETPKESRADETRGRCLAGMVEIEGKYCIDRYEASLVDVLPNGEERPHSPFTSVGDSRVRAVSSANVFPQGYISAVEAAGACAASGKRLCRVAEWQKACRGPEKRAFGYSARREPGRCNDNGRNPVISLHGRGHWNWSTMNLPELNQLDGTLSRTGEHSGCTNGYGVYDMVGNLHEWVADPGGTFYGGYYQDVSSVGHGAGCGYLTTAHEARYHDYSTGFRCCADVAGAAGSSEASPAAVPASRRPRKRR